MRFILKLALFLCLPFGAFSQEIKVSHYKDLPGNGEVFLVALIENIQHKNLPTNDTGIAYLDSAISYYSGKADPCLISSAYAVKARLYNNRGQQDSSAKYFLKAARINKPTCSKFNTYYLYNSWGILQEQLEEYEISDSLYAIALTATDFLDDKVYQLNVLNNRANILSKTKRIKEAIQIMKTILATSNQYNIYYHKLYSRQNLGAYYIDVKKLDSALIYLNELKELVIEDEQPDIAMDMYNNLGVCYQKRKEIELAYEYFEKAIKLATTYERLHKLLIYLNNYSSLLFKQGEFKRSRELLSDYIDIKDSLFNAEKYETIKILEAQYKVSLQREELLQRNLELEQNRRNRNTLLFVLAGVLIIAIALYSRLNYVRRSKKIVEREKKRSDDLLLNILPAEVAEELKETGESEARNFEHVTVLFTDFKDFTYVSEQLTAKELVGEINKFFKAFDSIVTEFGVEKIKTIGDAYMAASGLPKQSEKSAIKAVKAAIAMMEKALELNENLAQSGKPQFDMRIGLHTGPVVAGIVGVKKFQYDIWGDTVNTAARMESSCEPGRVNISKATYELVKNEPNLSFEFRGKIEAKGKGELEMFYVDNKKS